MLPLSITQQNALGPGPLIDAAIPGDFGLFDYLLGMAASSPGANLDGVVSLLSEKNPQHTDDVASMRNAKSSKDVVDTAWLAVQLPSDMATKSVFPKDVRQLPIEVDKKPIFLESEVKNRTDFLHANGTRFDSDFDSVIVRSAEKENSNKDHLSFKSATSALLVSPNRENTNVVGDARRQEVVERYQALGKTMEFNPDFEKTSDVRIDAVLAPSKGVQSKPDLLFRADKSDKKDAARSMASVGEAQPRLEIFSDNLTTSQVSKPKPKAMTVPEVVEHVKTLAQDGGGEMTVSLSPPELGRVDIKVSTRGNRVEIEMRSENAFAKGLLESSLGELRQSLEQQDLNLARVDVTTGHGIGFSFPGSSSFGRGAEREQSPYSMNAVAGMADAMNTSPVSFRAASIGRSIARGGVDLKV